MHTEEDIIRDLIYAQYANACGVQTVAVNAWVAT